MFLFYSFLPFQLSCLHYFFTVLMLFILHTSLVLLLYYCQSYHPNPIFTKKKTTKDINYSCRYLPSVLLDFKIFVPFFRKKKNLSWNIVDLRYSFSLRCTATWFLHIFFQIFSILDNYKILNTVPCAMEDIIVAYLL